jgi:hypothetical protein
MKARYLFGGQAVQGKLQQKYGTCRYGSVESPKPQTRERLQE